MGDSGIQHLEKLFTSVLDLEPQKRGAFLEQACRGDDALRNRIGELLAAYDRPCDFLQVSADAAQYIPESPCGKDAEGQRIGQYTIRRVIATGGMGVVYEAVQDHPRRTVALKVMRGGFFRDDTTLRRFRHEVEILGRLQHPNIARIHEAGVHENGSWTGDAVPFFAMEWIDGLPITDYARSFRLDVRERLQLMVKVCHAVQYAHQKGVIHRDLKPANILVVDGGEGGSGDQGIGGAQNASIPSPRSPGPSVPSSAQPKILDFGVARATCADLLVTTLKTDAGQLIGTIPYMSPEQMLGDPHEVDTRSDVYALGVTLYVLLAGRLPHEVDGKTVPEAIRIVREEKISSLGTIERSLRGDIETIVGKALEKDKARRYPSASDLAADIDRYLQGRAIQAHPPSTAYQLRKLVKRHRLTFALICFILVLMTVFGATAGVQAVRLNRQRQAEARQRLLAEQRSKDVRDLAMTFAFSVHDAIVELEGATAAKELILATSLEYLDGLASQKEGDIDLQRDLANAYIRIAEIQGDPYRPNVGQTKQALENGQKGMDLALSLWKAHPDRVDFLQTVVLGKNVMAGLLDASGKFRESVQTYQSAIQLREELSARGIDELSFPRLDRIHQRFGLTLYRLVDLVKALEQFERSAALMEELIKVYPEHERLPTNLAGTLVNIARCRSDMGALQDAFEPAEQARRILDLAIEEEPENYDYRRDRAAAYSILGCASAALGNAEKGIQFLEIALGEFQVQVENDAEDKSARRHMSVILHHLGKIRSDSNDLDAALDDFEQMLEIVAELSSNNPDSAMYKRDHAMALNQMGVVLRKKGRMEEALEHFLASQELFDELSKTNNKSSGARRDLIVSYYGLAEFHKALALNETDNVVDRRRYWQQTRTWFEKCRRVYDSLAKDGFGLAVDADVMKTLTGQIAQCDEALFHLDVDKQ
ncbi:MAG: protein kinase [Phycisphaerales bacterium]|nr:protein kinase [Phycisphaerales bacterium]